MMIMLTRLKITFTLIAIFCLVTALPAKEKLVLNTLVVVDRAANRIQPYFYQSLNSSAENSPYEIKPTFKFTVFNPFLINRLGLSGYDTEIQTNIYKHLDASVETLVKLKKDMKKGKNLCTEALDYIANNPDSNMAKAYNLANKYLAEFDFLLVESTGQTCVHPLYWDENTFDIEAKGADRGDVIDTAYALIFIDTAKNRNLPVYGSCHGAQIGYLQMGGGLEKVYDLEKMDLRPAVFGRKNPSSGPDEIWNIRKTNLNARLLDNPTVYGNLKYPLPDILKNEADKNKEMFINKDFNQTLGMTDPVPEELKIFTYHPLSKFNVHDEGALTLDELNKVNTERAKEGVNNHELKKIETENITQQYIENFDSSMHSMKIIDFFKHGSMVGTQYHPQYTYKDYDTGKIFDYLVKVIVEHRLAKKPSTEVSKK
jgi:hypothetical protein